MSSPSSTLRTTAAAALRAEMARQRRTSKDLASVLHCSQSSASRRMTGETGLDLDEVAVIAEWLGVSIGSLLSSTQSAAA